MKGFIECLKVYLQLEEWHQLLFVEIFGECICSSSHHHIAIVVDKTANKKSSNELPLMCLKAFVLHQINFQSITITVLLSKFCKDLQA